MVALNNNNPDKSMRGILTCACSKCGKQTVYEMSEDETKKYMEYQIKGRAMGSLRDIFPNIPTWILSGAIEPLANGRCICPSCETKRK